MIKDYSALPQTLTITNGNEFDVKIQLRDNWKLVPAIIRAGDILTISCTTSEDLALMTTQSEEMNLTVEAGDVPQPEVPAEVGTEEDLKEAIASGAKDVKLTDNITVPSGDLDITGVEHFDGNNKTLTFSEPGRNFIAMQATNGVIENISIKNTNDNTEWNSTNGIQCYDGTYTLKNVKATGCNVGIMVNAATVNLEGTIDVSGNTFGGINVSKGIETDHPLNNGILNINNATILNTTEAYSKPTIYTEGEGQQVNGAEAMFTNSEIKEGQVQYYLVESNAEPSEILVNGVQYTTLLDAINVVPDNIETSITLYKDITVDGEAVEIPSNKNIVLNLNGHTITGENFSANSRVLTNKGILAVNGEGEISTTNLGSKGTGAINNDGQLTINSGTFSGGVGANGAAVNNKAGATMIVNGGTFNGCPRAIQNLATLTINDGTFIGSDTYSGNEGNAVICGPSSNTTIKGGTFTGHMNGISVMDNAKATVKIEDGVFKSDGSENSGAIYNGLGNTITIDNCQAITEGDSACTFVNKGIATVNGGTFQGNNTNAQVYTVDSGQGASSKATIELKDKVNVTGTFGALRVTSGTATVKGGTYTVSESDGTSYYALYMSSASGNVTVNVENGTFTSPNNAVRCGESLYTKKCNLNISGGTFTSPTSVDAVVQEDPGVVTITGGTYSSNIETFVEEGYEVNEVEGKYVVNQVQ